MNVDSLAADVGVLVVEEAVDPVATLVTTNLRLL